jgi:hypothetical protein
MPNVLAPRLKWSLLLATAVWIGGCGKVQQKQPAEDAHAAAEAKRHKVACASSMAYDRLKNVIFDQAAERHRGNDRNLATLASFSFVRMDDPVVAGWDPMLDKTRCEGRFILDVPPGAERGLAGQHQLAADVTYTAQRAADGSGLVYELSGVDAIVARLAAFDLSGATYQPLPAVDAGKQTEIAETSAVAPAESPPPKTAITPSPDQEASTSAAAPATPQPEAIARATAVAPASPDAAGVFAGEATVRTFYTAVGAGNGALASAQVIPEKRSTRAFSADAISRFYGRLSEPLRLNYIEPLAGDAYRVRYRYAAANARCNGSAIVRLTRRDGRYLIRSITAPSGC